MTSRHTRAAILAACRKLWSIATLATIQGPHRMPGRAEFRKLVQAKVNEPQRRKERCRAMLDALSSQGQKPFQREPVPVRVRGLRDAFRRVGNVATVALYERELAETETRAPEVWAVEAPAGGSTP